MDAVQNLYWYHINPQYPATKNGWKISRINGLTPVYPAYYSFGTYIEYPELSVSVYNRNTYVDETSLSSTDNIVNGFTPITWKPIPCIHNYTCPRVFTDNFKSWMSNNLRLELSMARSIDLGSSSYLSEELEYTDKYYKITDNEYRTNKFAQTSPVLVDPNYNGVPLYEITTYNAPTKVQYSTSVEELTSAEYNSEVTLHGQSYSTVSYENSNLVCSSNGSESTDRYYTLNGTVYKYAYYQDIQVQPNDAYYTHDGSEYTDTYSTITYRHVTSYKKYIRNNMAYPITLYYASQDKNLTCTQTNGEVINTFRGISCTADRYNISIDNASPSTISSVEIASNARAEVDDNSQFIEDASVLYNYIGDAPGSTYSNTSNSYTGEHTLSRTMFYCWKPVVPDELMSDS